MKEMVQMGITMMKMKVYFMITVISIFKFMRIVYVWSDLDPNETGRQPPTTFNNNRNREQIETVAGGKGKYFQVWIRFLFHIQYHILY